MNAIVKERVENYTVYQAADGTEFNSSEECARYEASARGVLRGKLKELTVNDAYNGWTLMGGDEDNQIIAVKVPYESSIDVILQNYYLDQPWVLKEAHKQVKEKVDKAVKQAYAEEDIVLFGINCEDELYFIDTRNNIINRLNSLDKENKADNK